MKELLAVVIVLVLLAVIGSSAGLFDGNRSYMNYGYGGQSGGDSGLLVGILVALFFIIVFGMLALGVYIGLSQAKTWFMAGAEAALKNKDMDNRADAQKTAALANLTRTALSLGARSAPADYVPPGPAPLGTQENWLPELTEYSRPALPEPDPDVWDVELDGEGDTDE